MIAGQTAAGTRGAVSNEYVNPTCLDVTLPDGESFSQEVGAGDNTFLYVIEGGLKVGATGTAVDARTMGILGPGDTVQVTAGEKTRFLLISAQPLNEPVARGGPFVMNTKEEIIQAFEDYRHNRF